MYVGVGDAGTGERPDIRRLNPQRLDNLNGKILRIVPDLREHTATSTVSENGRYRIPNDNPFVVDGGRAQGDLGVGPAQSASAGLGRRSARAARAAPARVQHRAHRLGDGRDHQEGRQLRLSPARRPAGDDAAGDDGGPGRRHHPGADHRHRHARHGDADISGDRLSATPPPAATRSPAASSIAARGSRH